MALGLNVLPIAPHKKKPPTIPWKSLQYQHVSQWDWSWEAADAAEGVDAWLREHWEKTENNLAVVTGLVSGIVVVDVDDDAAHRLVEAICGWPMTVSVRSSRGWHVWFAHGGEKRGNRTRVKGLGLDVRGDGGYAVVPPSIHPSGSTYRWEVSPSDADAWPPPRMPEALEEVLWKKPAPRRPSRFPRAPKGPRADGYVGAAFTREATAVATAPEGARNDTLNRAAFSLARFVTAGLLDQAEVEEILMVAAVDSGLEEDEARATIRSGLGAR